MRSIIVQTLLFYSTVSTNTNAFTFIAPASVTNGRCNGIELATQIDSELEPDSGTIITAQKTLGLLTFDLDDTLYPMNVVISEANAAFAKAMERFGYEGIKPSDIVEAAKKIRKEMPPDEAALLSFTETRKLAIRRVMEEITFKRKLEAMAEDFSTDVENLSKIVVEPARK